MRLLLAVTATHELFDARRYLIPFRSSLLPQVFCDTLIIGSGVAGLRAAIAAAAGAGGGAAGDVIVLGKDDAAQSNTAWAQGGIASVYAPEDTEASHVADTLAAGAGLCDAPVVERIVAAGPARVRELIDWGMRFDDDGRGTLRLGREGGHSLSRILHADGDATGRELMRTLWERVRATPGVRVFTRCFALDLLTPSTAPGSPCMGAITHHPKYGLQVIWAKSVVLASGGAGMVFRETTNPKSATGDGVAMAYRAGASVADMAFVQFHPTTLYLAGAARSLITEAVRGEGALLVDHAGERFMVGQHPLAELAPRDVVTRGIVRQLALRGGTHVFLDARKITDFASKFPGITALLEKFDLDPAVDLVPVHPAAHYLVGGVVTDELGRSDVPGLFVAGETACTGLHGANRLASNSLLEGLVMGEAVGRAAAARAAGQAAAESHGGGNGFGNGFGNGVAAAWAVPPRSAPVPIISDIRPSESAELDLDDVESSLRSAMWRNAGIERAGGRLADVQDMIGFWARYTLDKIFDDTRGWQLQNLLMTSWLIARSAAWRCESRGCHWRSDYPDTLAELAVHDLWRRPAAAAGVGAAGAAGGPVLRPVRGAVPGAAAGVVR